MKSIKVKMRNSVANPNGVYPKGELLTLPMDDAEAFLLNGSAECADAKSQAAFDKWFDDPEGERFGDAIESQDKDSRAQTVAKWDGDNWEPVKQSKPTSTSKTTTASRARRSTPKAEFTACVSGGETAATKTRVGRKLASRKRDE